MAAEAKEGKQYVYRAIIERIRTMIRNGELKPGDRLPPERRLAELFGVSRHSLRQAFQALAERKMLESRQGDGTYLLAGNEAAFSGEAILDAIGEQSSFLTDIIEFRRIVEPRIAALAAQRITPENIDRLKILVCDQQRALMAGREDDGLDAEFHRVLAASSGNRVIGQVMATIQSIVDESRSVWLQSIERRHDSVEGHLRIIDALEAGDVEAACTAMHHHIVEIEQHIFGNQPEIERDCTVDKP